MANKLQDMLTCSNFYNCSNKVESIKVIGEENLLKKAMKIVKILILFVSVSTVKQLSFSQCHQCYRVIRYSFYTQRLTRNCALAILRNRCQVYRSKQKHCHSIYCQSFMYNKMSNSFLRRTLLK